jgi:hypothetical protein
MDSEVSVSPAPRGLDIQAPCRCLKGSTRFAGLVAPPEVVPHGGRQDDVSTLPVAKRRSGSEWVVPRSGVRRRNIEDGTRQAGDT